jgi:nucleoid-associated protein YgaU
MPELNGSQVEKMRIMAFATDSFDPIDLLSGNFFVDVNPGSYKLNYSTELNDNQAEGRSGDSPQYNISKPQDFNIDILFDGTGVLSPSGTSDVTLRIQEFLNIVYKYNGDTHQPNYVILIWGTLLFKGRLVNLDIDYKLFNPDGLPIRAVASCKFQSAIEQDLLAALENRRSPDVTHERVVKEGDNIFNITNTIYKDQKYYMDVARANKLNGFRKLSAGMKLRFPPLK